MRLEWLVIGGGIHGVHLAARLLGEAKVDPEQIRIVDPSDHLLARWRSCTATTGMTHLRSTSVHHLDPDPHALQQFAAKRKSRTVSNFVPPYRRPSLPLFDAHCRKVIKTYGLADLHTRGRVVSCGFRSGEGEVDLDGGQRLRARNLIFAIGSSETPNWPAWAPQSHPRVHHVFAPGFDGWPPGPSESVAVVGGGISAGQVALRLLREGHHAHLVSQHPLREHQFDSDPGWLGPKYMAGFSAERDIERRRRMIREARHRGSVPPDVRQALQRAIESEAVSWHESEVKGVEVRQDRLQLDLARETLQVDRLLLATGFAMERPGGPWVDDLIAEAQLPCAKCGYPIVDKELRWHPGLFVTGPLAELELGPASRNIAGARRAGDRIVTAAHST
ncbi:MAG: FAD/NAD(P)-binding protein [Myxococcota bacterium]